MEPARGSRFDSDVSLKRLPAVLITASLVACATPVSTPPQPPPGAAGAEPLSILPAEADLALVRRDLIATAEERLGSAMLAEALASPTHLIVKRFVGMAPPPPPGSGSDWAPRPAASVLVRGPGGWRVASASGWRGADAGAAAELDRLIADPLFWGEPPYTPPCPDFGASLLLLRAPGQIETVRNSTCSSRASQIVQAALRA